MRRVGDRLFGVGHPNKTMDLGRHRRSVLDRTSIAWTSEAELAGWAEGYEAELRRMGLIDFDDLVVFGQRLVSEHDWVLPLLQAKFPVLAVDEYQDLGVALHHIVKRVAFDGGVRLFAVGDPDQSIYGFTGADGALLQELAERHDVERVQLQLNYRSASRIVSASEMALGEARGYQSNDPARQAVIEFVQCPNGLEGQAAHAVAEILPAALAAKPGRALGDIAILYRDYRAGDVVAEAVAAAGFDFVRVDTAAPYRKVALYELDRGLRGLVLRWLARGSATVAWSAGPLAWISSHANLRSAGARRVPAFDAASMVPSRRGRTRRDFVAGVRAGMLDALMVAEPSLADQREQVDRMSAALAIGGALADLDLASLGGRDGSPLHLNLLTLHSAKGCEYDAVIMVGLDLGSMPWRNELPAARRESRRLFYVGLTRARDEIHMLYSGSGKYSARANALGTVALPR